MLQCVKSKHCLFVVDQKNLSVLFFRKTNWCREMIRLTVSWKTCHEIDRDAKKLPKTEEGGKCVCLCKCVCVGVCLCVCGCLCKCACVFMGVGISECECLQVCLCRGACSTFLVCVCVCVCFAIVHVWLSFWQSIWSSKNECVGCTASLTHSRTHILSLFYSFIQCAFFTLSLPLSDLPFLSNTLSLVVKHSMAVWLSSLMEARSHEEYQAAFFFCLRAKLLAMSDRHHSQWGHRVWTERMASPHQSPPPPLHSFLALERNFSSACTIFNNLWTLSTWLIQVAVMLFSWECLEPTYC